MTPEVQVENPLLSVDTASLQPLDTSVTLRFGDRSDNVYAMTERLVLLGLLDAATDTFDGTVLDAVSALRGSLGLGAGLYASPEVLAALDGAVQQLDGQSYMVDRQLEAALELCRQAAAEPQQYTALPDGSWTKN